MSISIDGNTLTIRLSYLTPSLNNLLGQSHWVLTKEKARAMVALSSELSAAERDSSTLTTWLGAQNISPTQFARWASWSKTARSPLRLSSRNRRFHAKTKKKQW